MGGGISDIQQNIRDTKVKAISYIGGLALIVTGAIITTTTALNKEYRTIKNSPQIKEYKLLTSQIIDTNKELADSSFYCLQQLALSGKYGDDIKEGLANLTREEYKRREILNNKLASLEERRTALSTDPGYALLDNMYDTLLDKRSNRGQFGGALLMLGVIVLGGSRKYADKRYFD